MRWAAVLFKILGIACAAGAMVLLLVVADWPRVAYGQFVSPHGPYDSLPSGCAACHVAHAGQGPRLLQRSEITTMCFVCHDGTGSRFDVASSFTNPDNTYFHPVKSTGNPEVGQVLECVDCHNPHAGHPRLLQSTDGTSRYTEGPNFCLACHGSVDRNFTGANDQYWENTLGNHVNPYAAHYDTTKAKLQPGSGTKVTCVTCHAPHGAKYGRLLDDREEELCFRCHNDTTSSMSGRNIKYEFIKEETVNGYVYRTSYHDIFGNNPEAKVECSSCHGPHTVAAVPLSSTSTTSLLSDPRNTKRPFAGQLADTGLGGIQSYKGDLSDFCLRCHEGYDAVPKAKASVTEFVPVSISFPTTVNFTTNSGGWWKGGFKLYAHGKAAITCGDCHESHGSDYPALQRYPEDTATTSGECLRCHDGSKTGVPDTKTYLTKQYKHPTLTVSGYVYHSNTESYANMPLASRHAECVDCHDPHQADRHDGSIIAPIARKPIAGVSGVSVTYDLSSSWDNWPSGVTFNLVLGVNYQYELCLKCHSYYSYGTNPPTSPSGGFPETDQAKEFNQNNPAYHAVVGESKIPMYDSNGDKVPDTYYGKFVPPWTATSRLYCSDCHAFADSNGSSQGPHGSDYQFILIAPWVPDTSRADATGNANTEGHLCFKCHDYNFYTGQDTGSPTNRSKFSSSSPSRYNLHTHRKPCAVCHGAVPHGWKQRGILVNATDERPYSYGSRLNLRSLPAPGAWDCNNCHAMHGG